MTDHAEQRPRLHCQAVFTWTPASPRKRFCSQPCRLAWWGARRRQATAALRHGDIRLPGDPRGSQPRATTHDGHGDNARSHDAGTLTATPACPHCRQPVAIVAWLVPPAAASVATPPRHALAATDNQQLTK